MMRKFINICLVLFLVSCGSGKTASVSTKTSAETGALHVTVESILDNSLTGDYVVGELLVKFKSGVTASQADKMHQAIGSSAVKKYASINNLELIKLRQDLSVTDAIVAYMSDPNVEYAEPNYMKYSFATRPNDTYFSQQWALENTGQFANGIAGADVQATDAWDIRTGTNVIIAINDSGVDYNHTDLVGNIYQNTAENCTDGIDNDANGYTDDCIGFDFSKCDLFNPESPSECLTTKTEDNDPMDELGHGTHVAGTTGAVGNNGSGISGLLWNVQLMPLRFLNADGEGTTAEAIAALDYAVANGADIINASYGGATFSNAERTAISAAHNAGVLVIAAAGNGGADGIGDNNDLDPTYPAAYDQPNIVAVAATDQSDMRASFSNYGLNSVDVAAPGVYILSTVPPGLIFSLCTGALFPGLDFCSGTSMATPHVSALAGLLYSYYTNFNHNQIKSTILRYVEVLPELDGWILTGGRINAYMALSSLLTPTGLIINETGATAINIEWTDNATGEDGYRIERSVAGGPFVQIATVGPGSSSLGDSGVTASATQLTFGDAGLAPQTTYSYRVIAFNNIGVSPNYSNVVTATTSAIASSGGGGGGCSIGAGQNVPTAIANIVFMMIPLVFIIIMRWKRRHKE